VSRDSIDPTVLRRRRRILEIAVLVAGLARRTRRNGSYDAAAVDSSPRARVAKRRNSLPESIDSVH
jgi:hypothetical protein